ncbi:MAG: glycosyltransferase [Actinobacteria bacterium]|nr:glycosyltransferase [Actinomycetota bacterium]
MNLRPHIVAMLQRALLVASYNVNRLIRRRLSRDPISWVVGPDECASMVLQLSGAIPGSYSVNFTEEFVYATNYDYRFRTSVGSRWRWAERIIAGPLLLGRLMNQAAGFIYVGATGFLLTGLDEREFEFSYLARKAVPIVCYWCGSDIRSIKLMHQLEKETGMPNISTYMGERGPIFESVAWDDSKRAIAAVASRYATAMFSNTVDHLSYLTKGTEPFLYFLSDEPLPNSAKFDDVSHLVVVHATTSPVIKGTPLVRAAVAQLRDEGYEFEYVELIGVTNAVVKKELARAHIALNQFYGFSPAVFGVEALAAGCVVMMSSDESVETDLPKDSNDCWVVTKHHQVYGNLKRLLDDPTQLAAIAGRGRRWAERYAMRSGAASILLPTLDAVLSGAYVAPEVRR